MGAIPLLNLARVKAKSSYGEKVPVIPSYEVSLKKGAYKEFKLQKDNWKLQDYYSNPGPI